MQGSWGPRSLPCIPFEPPAGSKWRLLPRQHFWGAKEDGDRETRGKCWVKRPGACVRLMVWRGIPLSPHHHSPALVWPCHGCGARLVPEHCFPGTGWPREVQRRKAFVGRMRSRESLGWAGAQGHRASVATGCPHATGLRPGAVTGWESSILNPYLGSSSWVRASYQPGLCRLSAWGRLRAGCRWGTALGDHPAGHCRKYTLQKGSWSARWGGRRV